MSELWVGNTKDGRHTVVYDTELQDASEYVFLYFVKGHTLCKLKKVYRERLNSVKNNYEVAEAIKQYQLWKLTGDKSTWSEVIPHPRKKCEVCSGLGTWVDNQDNRVSYGNHQPGSGNLIDKCSACNGTGYVFDLL